MKLCSDLKHEPLDMKDGDKVYLLSFKRHVRGESMSKYSSPIATSVLSS